MINIGQALFGATNGNHIIHVEIRQEVSLGLEPKPSVRGWLKIVYLTLAGLFMILGILGALLPVLPATPFLLLTSFFLLRTSPRLNDKLLQSRFLGPILKDWQLHGGVRKDVKIQAMLSVVILVGISLYFINGSEQLSAFIIMMASIGLLVIMLLPTPKNGRK